MSARVQPVPASVQLRELPQTNRVRVVPASTPASYRSLGRGAPKVSAPPTMPMSARPSSMTPRDGTVLGALKQMAGTGALSGSKGFSIRNSFRRNKSARRVRPSGPSCSVPDCISPHYLTQSNGRCTRCNRSALAAAAEDPVEEEGSDTAADPVFAGRGIGRRPSRQTVPSALSFEQIEQAQEAERKFTQKKELRGKFMAIMTELVLQGRRKVSLDTKWVVLPNGALRRYWDGLALAMLAYTAVFTPYQIAFLSDAHTMKGADGQFDVSGWAFIFVLDRMVDLFFYTDIVFNFRSAWESYDGRLVFVPSVAYRKYLCGYFALDLVSVLPYDFIAAFGTNEDSGGSAARLPRLLRLFRLAKIAKVLRASRIFKRWEQNISIKYGILRLINFLFGILIICHWMACGFFLTATTEDSPEGWINNFPPADQVPSAVNDTAVAPARRLAAGGSPPWTPRPGSYKSMGVNGVSDSYTASLYWGIMTLTTIGFGDIVPMTTSEKIYVIFAMVIGAGYFAYVVGTMCQLVQGLNIKTHKFQEQMDAMNEYLAVCQVPDIVRTRVRKYCFWRRDTSRVYDENALLGAISLSLRHEIVLHNHVHRLDRIPHFTSAPRAFIASLASLLTAVTYGPNDCVVREGEANSGFYIVAKGRIQCEDSWSAYVEIAEILHEGGFLGERGLMCPSFSSFTYRTLTFTELWKLETKDARAEIARWPIIQRKIRKMVVVGIWQGLLASGALSQFLKGDGATSLMAKVRLQVQAEQVTAPTLQTIKQDMASLQASVDARLGRMESMLEALCAAKDGADTGHAPTTAGV